MVEHGGLGRERRSRVVVGGDGVQKLGADVRRQRRRLLFDQP